MAGQLRFFGTLILAIQLSSCPESTRMAWEFEYPGTKTATLNSCKQVLEDLGYEIDVYAPESNLVVTTAKPVKYYLRRYDYSIVLGVSDRLKVYVTAQEYVYKRGSQVSLFGKTMLDSDVKDKLPFGLQTVIINPIRGEFQQLGINELINERPRSKG